MKQSRTFLYLIVIFVTLVIGICVPLRSEADPKKDLFQKLVHSVLTHGKPPETETWFQLVNNVATRTLTLQFQQTLRRSMRAELHPEVTEHIYGQILGRFRRALARLTRRSELNTTITIETERLSGMSLTRLYDEMAEIFKTPDDLLKFIESNAWANELLTIEEKLWLRTLRTRFHSMETPARHLILTIQALPEGTTIESEELKLLGEVKALLEREGHQMSSVQDIIKLSQEKQWIERGLLKSEHIAILRRLLGLISADLFKPTPFSGCINRQAFLNVTRLSQKQIFENLDLLACSARQGLRSTPDMIEAIFRSLSETHQALWSLAEARFSLKIRYQFWSLWRNYISKKPALQGRWRLLHWRAKSLLLPTRLPKDRAEVAQFFRDLTTLLAEAIYSQPGAVLRIPTPAYIERAIEPHAHVLAADFTVLKSLRQLSPEFETLVSTKEAQAPQLLALEEVFNTEGLPGLLRTLGETEGGYHLLPWDGLRYSQRNLFFGLSRVPVGLHRRERGRHFRQWGGRNFTAALGALCVSSMALDVYAGWREYEELSPPFRPDVYPGDLPITGDPVHGGIRPDIEESVLDQSFLLYATQAAVIKLKTHEKKLSETKDPNEVLFLREEIENSREEIYTYVEADPRIQEAVRSIQTLMEHIESKTEEQLLLDEQKPEDQIKIRSIEAALQMAGIELDTQHDHLDQILDTIIEEIYSQLTQPSAPQENR